MDLKAVHAELGKLVAIDEHIRVIPHTGPCSVDSICLTREEALQILNQRRAACQERLRALGFVAAHDSTAQTLREFRDRADRQYMPYPSTDRVNIGTSPQDMRSASSLGFSG